MPNTCSVSKPMRCTLFFESLHVKNVAEAALLSIVVSGSQRRCAFSVARRDKMADYWREGGHNICF